MRRLWQDIYHHARRFHIISRDANGRCTADEISVGSGSAVEISPLPHSKLAATNFWNIGVDRWRRTHDLELPFANQRKSHCTNVRASDFVASHESKRVRRDASDAHAHVEIYVTDAATDIDARRQQRLHESI